MVFRIKKVIEETDLKPLSIYNKTKMIAERVFLSYSKHLNTTIIRPATVCGLSKKVKIRCFSKHANLSGLQK